nr:hypothetical protein [Tanacetum cinerariifolium]
MSSVPLEVALSVFQTLCKQGHWFSFAKRRAPTLVCIDDNRSCIKSWKSGFFLIDRRAIPDYMSLRHPSSAIDDPKPPVGSYSQKDVRRLSAHVVKLRDISDGGVGLVWFKSGLEESTFQRLPFYCTPPAAADAAIPDPTPQDLAAERKASLSLSGAPSGHVAKRTWSAMAQSSGSTTRPNLFADNSKESDVDEDACVEILLITHLRSVVVIPTEGNQSGGSVMPTAEGPIIQDSQGKVIMTDAAGASSVGGSRPRPSSGLAPSVQDFYGDVIHRDLFPFSPGPYYALYPEDESLQERCGAFHGMDFEVSGLKKQVIDLNDKLSSSSIAFVKAKAKGMDRKKKIKSLSKNLNQLTPEVARFSIALNQATAAFKVWSGSSLPMTSLGEFKVNSFFWLLGFERGLSMHRTKEDFVVVLKKISHFVPGAPGRLDEASPLVA